jgi:hypothetical protein
MIDPKLKSKIKIYNKIVQMPSEPAYKHYTCKHTKTPNFQAESSQ